MKEMSEEVAKKKMLKLRIVFVREKLKGEFKQLSLQLKLNGRRTLS